MPKTDAQKRAQSKYESKAYAKILLRVRADEIDEIRAAIEASGESVNGYIIKAIRQRMERERKER